VHHASLPAGLNWSRGGQLRADAVGFGGGATLCHNDGAVGSNSSKRKKQAHQCRTFAAGDDMIEGNDDERSAKLWSRREAQRAGKLERAATCQRIKRVLPWCPPDHIGDSVFAAVARSGITLLKLPARGQVGGFRICNQAEHRLGSNDAEVDGR
jgi:hypothetical protein